jgi:hypothetical protein
MRRISATHLQRKPLTDHNRDPRSVSCFGGTDRSAFNLVGTQAVRERLRWELQVGPGAGQLQRTWTYSTGTGAPRTICRLVRYISSTIRFCANRCGRNTSSHGCIGEHSKEIRQQVCDRLRWVGVKIDRSANDQAEQCVSAKNSEVDILIIPTSEATTIARQCSATLSKVFSR